PALRTTHYSPTHYSPTPLLTSPSRLQQPPRIRLELVLDHPARDLAVGGEPDLGKSCHVFEQLLEDCRDHRPAAEVAVHRQRQKPWRLVLIEEIERLLVHLPQVERARPQHSVVREVTDR